MNKFGGELERSIEQGMIEDGEAPGKNFWVIEQEFEVE
jgi:hypothetical protein